MALFRKIFVDFWRDCADMKPETKLLYLYCMSNPGTAACGIQRLRWHTILHATGLTDKALKTAFDDLCEQRKVLYCQDTEEVMILTWLDWNGSRSEKVEQRRERELISVRHRPFVDAYHKLAAGEIEYRYCIALDGYTMHTVSTAADTVSRPIKRRAEKSREEQSTCIGAPAAVPGLHGQVVSAFQAKHPKEAGWDYGLEGKAIKGLIAKAVAAHPDDPGAFISTLMGAFWKLREDEEFFGKQPFLPHILNSAKMYAQVGARMEAKPELSAEAEATIEEVTG